MIRALPMCVVVALGLGLLVLLLLALGPDGWLIALLLFTVLHVVAVFYYGRIPL